jgi:O-antigen/teichoic acid export membrane protein
MSTVDIKQEKRTLFLFKLNLVLTVVNIILMMVLGPLGPHFVGIFAICMFLHLSAAASNALLLIKYEKDKLK